MIAIPHRELSGEALQSLIEEFVTRDGTDYGEQEVSLQSKVALVMSKLEQGSWVIVYDDSEGSIGIVEKDQLTQIRPDS